MLAERSREFFELSGESPYMLLVADLREPVDWTGLRYGDGDMLKLLTQKRSLLPGITHVDYSARVQTVDFERNPSLHGLMSKFGNCPGTPRFERENRSVRQRTPMPIRLCSRPDSISFSRRHRPIVPWVSKIGGTWAVTKFDEITGCPVLINTSFNVRGEPIVCTPADATRCFLNAGIELLSIGSQLAFKSQQSAELRAIVGSVEHEPD